MSQVPAQALLVSVKRKVKEACSPWTENWQKQNLDQEGLMDFLLHY